MRAVGLTADPFEFVNFMEVECIKELNQHGIIRITGIIRADIYPDD